MAKHCFCEYKPVKNNKFGKHYNGRGWYFCCGCGDSEPKEERKGNIDHKHNDSAACKKG